MPSTTYMYTYINIIIKISIKKFWLYIWIYCHMYSKLINIRIFFTKANEITNEILSIYIFKYHCSTHFTQFACEQKSIFKCSSTDRKILCRGVYRCIDSPVIMAYALRTGVCGKSYPRTLNSQAISSSAVRTKALALDTSISIRIDWILSCHALPEYLSGNGYAGCGL